MDKMNQALTIIRNMISEAQDDRILNLEKGMEKQLYNQTDVDLGDVQKKNNELEIKLDTLKNVEGILSNINGQESDAVMEKLKINDPCYITENARVMLGLPDGIVYTVKDILQEDIDFPIVLNAKEFGKDWFQFFKTEEIITLKEYTCI